MTFILLVAVGLDLTRADFLRLRGRPCVVLTGVLAPLFMLPPLAVQLTQAFQTQPDVTGGIFLVAACPIGGISNTYSYLARASTALSVTLTGLSCLCASLTIPLISKGLELAVDRSLAFAAPIPLLAGQFVLMLIAPVSIGIWVRRHWPLLAERYRPVLRRLAIAGICIPISTARTAVRDSRLCDRCRTTVPERRWPIGRSAGNVRRNTPTRRTVAFTLSLWHVLPAARGIGLSMMSTIGRPASRRHLPGSWRSRKPPICSPEA